MPLQSYIALVLPRTSRLSVPIPVIASVVVAFLACGRTGLDGTLGGGAAAGRATGAAGQGAAGHGGSGGFATGGFATGGFATGGFATGGFGGFATGGFGGFSDLAGVGGGSIGGVGGFELAGAGGGSIGGAGGVNGCVNGFNDCADPSTVRICFEGVAMTFACPFGCFNGVCTECVPGTSTCSSNDEVQLCSATGILQPPQPCGGPCTDGACVGCTEGDTRCASTSTQQTCKAGKWTADLACPSLCVDKTCGLRVRHVFVTSKAFVAGSLGGLTGGDDVCRVLATAAGLSSSYSAWLSDDTGSPSTRFPQDVGPYVLIDGTVVANNWADLTSGTLRHPIDQNEKGGPGASSPSSFISTAVWTGTTAAGTLSTLGADPTLGGSCGNWSDLNGRSVVFGTTEGTDASWTEFGVEGSDPGTSPAICALSAALYCFEQ